VQPVPSTCAAAIFALDLRVNDLEVHEQRIVADTASVRLITAGALLTLMISAGADSQCFTQHRDRPVVSIPVNERALHINSFAKYVAFFL